MKMEEIEIGSRWIDNSNRYKLIEVIDKTDNSINFKDSGNFWSWISIDDFNRIDRKTSKVRFEKIK
jgi:hypothetical protein